jgi:hypothetical protein
VERTGFEAPRRGRSRRARMAAGWAAGVVLALGCAAAPAGAAERGFELVTPPGDELYPTVLNGADASGDNVYFSVADANPLGTREDGGGLDIYAATRGASSWASSWISPFCPGARSVADFGSCDNTYSTSDAASFFAGYGGKALFVTGMPTGGNDTTVAPDVFLGQPDFVTLLSADPSRAALGINGGGASIASSVDLTSVVFPTQQQLLAADTDGATDLYANIDGTLRLLTVDNTGALAACPNVTCNGATSGFGAPANGNPQLGPALKGNPISADEKRIFFTTQKQVAAGVDVDGVADLYVHDETTDTRRLLSGTTTAVPTFEWAAVDGSRVFLTTTEKLDPVADPDSVTDVYAVDAATGTPTLVSQGTTTATQMRFIVASDDGSHAWFASSDALDGAPLGPAPKLYEWNQGTIDYVGTLATGEPLVSSTFRTRPVRATASGNALFFSTNAPLLPAQDTNAVADVYRWSGGQLTLLTPRPANANNAAATLGGSGAIGIMGRAITSDGNSAFLTTGESFAAEDTDGGRLDVYEAGPGGLSLVSPVGDAAADAVYGESSADGRDVFFSTHESIVGWDTDDGAQDIYDARLGGGFPEPAPVTPTVGAPIGGGGPAAPPSLPKPATTAGGTSGNDVAPPADPPAEPTDTVSPVRVTSSALSVGRSSVRLRVTAQSPGQLVATLTARRKGRLVVLARGSRTLAGPGAATVTLKLTKAGRARLRAGRPVRGQVRTTLTTADGSVAMGASKVKVNAKGARHA